MKILVTGGAGFIGSHLVDALIKRGDACVVLDSLEPQVHRGKKPDYLNPKAEYRFGELSEDRLLSQALNGVEAIVHLAARVGVGQSMYEMARYIEGNTLATAKLLEGVASRQSSVKGLVVASSMSIYGEGLYRCKEHGEVAPPLRDQKQLAQHQWDMLCPHCRKILAPIPTPEDKPLAPTSVYAISKRDQEELTLTVAAAYGIPAVALRFFNVYGPRQSLSNPYTGACAIFLSRLRSGKPPVLYEDGNQTRDFIHVSDIVRAILLALDDRHLAGGIFNVGTGNAVSIRQIAEELMDIVGENPSPIVRGQYRAGDIRHCFADITRLSRYGFRPQVELGEGLKELAEWSSSAEALDLFESAERELAERNLLSE